VSRRISSLWVNLALSGMIEPPRLQQAGACR
jgi:hypothetical protein